MPREGGDNNYWTNKRQANVRAAGVRESGNKKGHTDFRDAQLKMQKAVQKHLDNAYESSSDEEELETENILGSLLKNYSLLGGTNEDLGRTQNFLENAFQSGAAVCLICIGSVKRVDSIWSCESCYGFFHLLCIQRWAKDSIAHQKLVAEDGQVKKDIVYNWQCPKCRQDYKGNNIPDRYECFCGSKVDPEFHPWLIPHSCGETCNKPLLPKCGHNCLLLCHPGPCPPCPKIVKSHCFCNKSAVTTVRCSRKERSCGGICSKKLPCNKHKCTEICHKDDCPPCREQSLVACQCGLNTKLTDCAQLSWQCDKVCGKAYACGFHFCEIACHRGECGSCPRTLPRTCPCGNESYLIPCTEDAVTCGGTCGKVLDCGMHSCFERCHRGPCGNCMEFLVKSCRCGLHKKEVPCQKEYLCDTKCKGLRDCHSHTCNRKCCDGRCPPCEKPCNKTLGCGQHKCSSICHRGPCYPCTLIKTVSCTCGATSITMPCGTSKKRIYIRCNKLCKIPPDCHHEKREEHRCHLGSCPPCRLPCGKSRICRHDCLLQCHSSVLVTAQSNHKPDTPWEKMIAPVEIKCLPCPPCDVPVPVWCPGHHELLQLPCHRAFEQSCGRKCGRLLACTNHQCSLACHTIINPRMMTLPSSSDTEPFEGYGDTCEDCNCDCTAERPCVHPCPLTCHPPPCPPCDVMVKIRCHCSINTLYMKCFQWVKATDEYKKTMLSCLNQCPKTISCGHRCSFMCHPEGNCTQVDLCEQAVTIKCPCKRRRKYVDCNLVKNNPMGCDAICDALKMEKQLKEEKEKEEARLAEERRNREELEKYEKKLHGGKRQRKRRIINEDFGNGSFWIRNKLIVIIVSISFIVGILAYQILKIK